MILSVFLARIDFVGPAPVDYRVRQPEAGMAKRLLAMLMGFVGR
jgi:hypothetical protein